MPGRRSRHRSTKVFGTDAGKRLLGTGGSAAESNYQADPAVQASRSYEIDRRAEDGAHSCFSLVHTAKNQIAKRQPVVSWVGAYRKAIRRDFDDLISMVPIERPVWFAQSVGRTSRPMPESVAFLNSAKGYP